MPGLEATMKKTWLALAAIPVLAGCTDNAMYSQAACIDSATYVRLDNSACSPNYGPPMGTHTWAYNSYRYDDPNIPVYYVGQPVPRTTYVLTRPSRITINHISDPAPVRPAGSKAVSVQQPTQSFLTDKRMAPARAASPNIVRGGLGVPGARATNVPVPNRTLSSPAPGRSVSSPPAPSISTYRAPSGSSFSSSSSRSFSSGRTR